MKPSGNIVLPGNVQKNLYVKHLTKKKNKPCLSETLSFSWYSDPRVYHEQKYIYSNLHEENSVEKHEG